MKRVDHAREAEHLLSKSSFWRHGVPSYSDGTPMPESVRDDMVNRALVHAVLAVASALTPPVEEAAHVD